MVLLGYRISKEILQLNPDRAMPVLETPVLKYAEELRRVVGMSTYYATMDYFLFWNVKPQVIAKKFPL